MIAAVALDSAGKTLIAAHPAAGLALQGAARVVSALFPIAEAVTELRAKEFKKILEQATGENWSDEGFEAWIAVHKGDETFQETIHETAQAYGRRVSPEVGPAIAMLYREYSRAGKRPDRFYRNCLALLCELDSGEFDTLKEAMLAMDDGLTVELSFAGEFQFRAQPERDGKYRFEVSNNLGAKTSFVGQPMRSSHLRQVFRSLAKRELGSGQDTPTAANEATPLGMSKAQISRLRGIVSPRTGASLT